MAAGLPEERLLRDYLQRRQTAPWDQAIYLFNRAIALAVIRALRQPAASDVDVVNDRINDVYVKLCSDNYRILRNSHAEHPAALFALVQAVATTTVFDWRDKEKARSRGGGVGNIPLDDVVSSHAVADDDKRIERETLIVEIERALKKLCLRSGKPPAECRDRHIFWLHFRHGCTAKEIAAIPTLNLTPKGVESAIHRIVTELRRLLGESREGQAS